MKRSMRLGLWLGVLVVALVCWVVGGGERASRPVADGGAGDGRADSGRIEMPGEVVGGSGSMAVRGEEAAEAFAGWMHREAAGGEPDRAEGVRLARERAAWMAGLMEEAPERALREAVGMAAWASLPDEVRAWVEEPFSVRGTVWVEPDCPVPGLRGAAVAGGAGRRVLRVDGEEGRWSLRVFGRRSALGTKEGAGVQGIRLLGRAVLREEVLQRLAGADRSHAEAALAVHGGERRCFVSGDLLDDGSGVLAVLGGERFYFRGEAELAEAESVLSALDVLPGPHAGSHAVFAKGDEPVGGVGEAAALAETLASAWTETAKSVYFIRVDFSDEPGASVGQAALAGILNTTVTENIEAMSYGKTEINAEVSPMVVRLPDPKAAYLPGGSDKIHDDAKAAFDLLNTGVDLAAYDIVGVHFASIGMVGSSGNVFTGRAGGSRQWLQGSSNPEVIVHEFGHNYGLAHSSFWDTAGASVVGSGTSIEYGDPFDVMGSGPIPAGHFHAQGKQRLNWLAAGEWADATASGNGTYRLTAIDDPLASGVRGVRVTKGGGEYYWLSYRANFPGNPWLANGANVVWQRSGEQRSWLVDLTPGSVSGKDDAALAIGRTYSDPAAGVHLTAVGKGGDGSGRWMDVVVNAGAFPGNLAPVATVSGPLSVVARNDAGYSVVASDGDGDALALGWDSGDGSFFPNAAAVTANWAVGGSYSLSVEASDMKGGVGTDSLAVTVVDPLDAWTAGSVPQAVSMDDVLYARGRYLALGRRYAFLSFDGVTWEESYLGFDFQSAQALAYGGGRFVAVGGDWNGSAWESSIYTSEDGRVWQRVEGVPNRGILRDVAYGGGTWVAVADVGGLLRSSDGGATWVGESAGTAVDFDGVAYGGGGWFLAVGENQVVRSANGVDWEDVSGATGLASWHTFRQVVDHGGVFFAGGWYSGIRKSDDGGQTWEQASMPAGVDYDVRAIVVGDGVLVATADRKDGSDERVLLVSGDGDRWSESGAVGFPSAEGVALSGGRAVAVHGADGGADVSDPFYPGNAAPTGSLTAPATGDARALLAFSASASDADGDPLTYVWDFGDGTALVDGESVTRRYVAGGSYDVVLRVIDGRGGIFTETQTVVVTDPANTWTERVSGVAETGDLQAVASGDGRVVAVGSDFSTFRGPWAVSTDGETWTAGVFGNNEQLYGVVWTGSEFVAVGQDYDFSFGGWRGMILASADGMNWTNRLWDGGELNAVASNGTVHVAVGNGGLVRRSTDGTSWPVVPSGTTTDLRGVAWGDGVFVAVGSASNGSSVAVVTSPDGLTWTDYSGGTGLAAWQGLRDVVWAGDRFLASGWYSKTRVSTDGGQTWSSTQANQVITPAMAAGGGVYFAAGVDKDDGDAAVNFLSTDSVNWVVSAAAVQPERNAATFFAGTFLTVGNDGSIWQSGSLEPEPTGFEAWRLTAYPGLGPGSGPLDDPDRDGCVNLWEYLLGKDPAVADAGGDGVVEAVEGGYRTVTVTRVAGTGDVEVTVEVSGDLESWSTAGTVVLEDTETVLKVRAPDLFGSQGREYLRVRLTVGG